MIKGAEIGVTRLPPKEYQGLSATNYQKLEKQGFSPTNVSVTLANTLVLEFWPPGTTRE